MSGGDYSFLAAGYAALEAEAKARGITYLKQVFPTGSGGTQDFAPYLTTAAHSNVDVILCGALEGDAGRLIKQARQLARPGVQLRAAKARKYQLRPRFRQSAQMLKGCARGIEKHHAVARHQHIGTK